MQGAVQTPTAAMQRYTAWQQAVRQAGGTPTRMPSGANKGDLAARYGAARPYRYELAPLYIRAADRATLPGLAFDAALGKAVEARDKTKAVVQDAVKVVASVPREAIGAVLGVPPWFVTAALIAAGAYVVYRFVPTLSRSGAR